MSQPNPVSQPLASEGPETPLTPELISGYLNRFEALCEKAAHMRFGEDYAEVVAQRVQQRTFLAKLLSEVSQLRVDLAAARSLLREAQQDSEDAQRWRYVRQFLDVTRWELSPASQLNGAFFRALWLPRSDATVEEIVDAGRSTSNPSTPLDSAPSAEDSTPDKHSLEDTK